MVLWPCLHCPEMKGCQHKREVLAAMRPYGVTTATIWCGNMWSWYPAGQRVRADVQRANTEENHLYGGGEFTVSYGSVTGIVVRRIRRKLQVWVEDDPDGLILSESGLITLYPDRLELVDGSVPTCNECNRPLHLSEGRKGGKGMDWDPCDVCQGAIVPLTGETPHA